MVPCGGCGDDYVGADAGSSDAQSSGEHSSSTSASDECSGVHEGDLHVLEDADLASLSDLGHVTGYIKISMGMKEQVDLSFLACLESVDLGMFIESNGWLETTEGLTRITKLPNLVVDRNTNLRAIAGFEQVNELGSLDIWSNPALREIHLESVESITRLTVGHCMGPGTALTGNAALTDVDGFANLARVGDLNIRGNDGLVSTQVLDVLMTNGAGPLEDVEIMWNASLPEQEVNAKLDAVGVTGVRAVCGNAGGVQDQCDCGIE